MAAIDPDEQKNLRRNTDAPHLDTLYLSRRNLMVASKVEASANGHKQR